MTGELKRGEELLSDLQDQQKAAMAKVKELRQQRKQLMGKAAAEAETKRREQAERTAARQRASVKTEKNNQCCTESIERAKEECMIGSGKRAKGCGSGWCGCILHAHLAGARDGWKVRVP